MATTARLGNPSATTPHRRRFLRLASGLAAAILLLGTAACGKTAAPAAPAPPAAPAGQATPPAPPAVKTVRLGLLVGNLGSLALALPTVQDKYQLKYDIKTFNDTTAAMLALDQGDIDEANLTTQHLVRAMEQGIPVVMVAGWGGGYNVLVARADLAVKADDWAGLKTLAAQRKAAGKPIKIGVPTGSLQHLKLIFSLKENGIDPDKDVDIVNVPFPEHPRAIEGGELDMAQTVAVFGALSITSGKGKLFAHIVGTRSGRQEIGMAVSKKLIDKDPDLVQRIVGSTVEAMNQFVGDVDKQVALEQQYTKLPRPVLEMAQGQFLRLNYRINIDQIQGMAKEMNEIGWTKQDFSSKVTDYVNLSFLSKATGLPVDQLSKW